MIDLPAGVSRTASRFGGPFLSIIICVRLPKVDATEPNIERIPEIRPETTERTAPTRTENALGIRVRGRSELRAEVTRPKESRIPLPRPVITCRPAESRRVGARFMALLIRSAAVRMAEAT